MARPVERVAHVSDLHHLAGVHGGHAVGELGGQREVVRDKDRGETQLRLEPAQELDDRPLRQDIERGGRLVEDEHLWIEQQAHRQQDPLAHPPGQLVWIGVEHAFGVQLHQA